MQRIYFKLCPEDFPYDDWDRDAYTEAVFSGGSFTSILLDQCAASEEDCVFSTTVSVNVVASDPENADAELYIRRYVDVPVYLKYLDMNVFGKSSPRFPFCLFILYPHSFCASWGAAMDTANLFIKALDAYFELYVEAAYTENILTQAPEAHIYGYASPYKSDRSICAHHGCYCADGNLVDQVQDADRILVTNFTYGFDII